MFQYTKIFPHLGNCVSRFLILCNNDFGVIVKIVINENGNYFFVAHHLPATCGASLPVLNYDSHIIVT